MVELRSKHEDSANKWYGVDVFSGKVKDMKTLNVIEPLRVISQVLKSATEAASMLLRIDDVVSAKGTAMKPPGPPGGMGGMGPEDY
jgi:chaperonin GroEL (HSP60 family)